MEISQETRNMANLFWERVQETEERLSGLQIEGGGFRPYLWALFPDGAESKDDGAAISVNSDTGLWEVSLPGDDGWSKIKYDSFDEAITAIQDAYSG